uniref:Uncharacterized protein n=1 Tax=Cacopsylla melanoneura TaxID=428564 RepID=A0A8D9AUT8_9HEMI
MASSSTLLLVLAGVCLAIVCARPQDPQTHDHGDHQELVDHFQKDFNASLHDLADYFHTINKVSEDVEYNKKLRELIDLVHDAQEVKEAKEKLKNDADALLESLKKVLVPHEEQA